MQEKNVNWAGGTGESELHRPPKRRAPSPWKTGRPGWSSCSRQAIEEMRCGGHEGIMAGMVRPPRIWMAVIPKRTISGTAFGSSSIESHDCDEDIIPRDGDEEAAAHPKPYPFCEKKGCPQKAGQTDEPEKDLGPEGVDKDTPVKYRSGCHISFIIPQGATGYAKRMRRIRTSAIRSPGKAGLPARLPGSFPAFLAHCLMYPRIIAGAAGADRRFTADGRCTSCGICEQVSPVENIRLDAARPVWLRHCLM